MRKKGGGVGGEKSEKESEREREGKKRKKEKDTYYKILAHEILETKKSCNLVMTTGDPGKPVV